MTQIDVLKETNEKMEHELYRYAIDVSAAAWAGDQLKDWLLSVYDLNYKYFFFNTLLWYLRVNEEGGLSYGTIKVGGKTINDEEYSKEYILNYIKNKNRDKKLKRILYEV